jgi:hypothetical protein
MEEKRTGFELVVAWAGCGHDLETSSDGAQASVMENRMAIFVAAHDGVVVSRIAMENVERVEVIVCEIASWIGSTSASVVVCIHGRGSEGRSCRWCVVGLCRSRHRHDVVAIGNVEGESVARYHDDCFSSHLLPDRLGRCDYVDHVAQHALVS